MANLQSAWQVILQASDAELRESILHLPSRHQHRIAFLTQPQQQQQPRQAWADIQDTTPLQQHPKQPPPAKQPPPKLPDHIHRPNPDQPPQAAPRQAQTPSRSIFPQASPQPTQQQPSTFPQASRSPHSSSQHRKPIPCTTATTSTLWCRTARSTARLP